MKHFWAAANAQPYKYDALSKPKTIRLLRLDEAGSDDKISVSLHTFSVDGAPPYFSLSYCWGLPEPSVTILCDGQPFRVTLNLAKAMRHLQALPQRHFAGCDLATKWFWIDQICINQQDASERCSQVQLMQLIYENAVRTLIWLGPVTGSAHLGWSLVDQIYTVFRNENPDATDMADIKVRLYSTSFHKECGLPDWRDDCWGQFWEILQAPWFRRIWIIQEVALSRQDPLILQGDFMYPWERIGWVATWMRRTGFIRLNQIPSQLLNVDTISGIRRSHVRWTLPAILMATSGKFLATDPRDKIFGLLGLILETERPDSRPAALVPDYHHRNVAEVYQDVTQFLIREYGNLAILDRTIARLNRSSWLHPTPRTAAVVPSWVPNWSVLTEPSQPRYLSWATYHGRKGGADLAFPVNYKAAADIPADMVPAHGGRVLQLRGLRVDTVMYTSSVAHPFTLHLETDNWLRKKLQDLPLWPHFDGTTLLGRTLLLLTSIFRKPLFLRYWNMAIHASEDFDAVGLIDAFIKCTTADHFSVSGTSSEQIRKDGCAYLLTQLKVAEDKKGLAASIPVPFFQGSAKRAADLKVLQENAVGGNPAAYASLARNYCLNRRFFITHDRRLGIGPKWTKKGDLVCVLFGGGVPYVVRPKEGAHFKFIGESYVHGLMDGQAVETWRKGELKEELFGLR